MVESLRAAIAKNKIFEPPDLTMFYGLITEMDRACPPELFVKRWVGKIRRAARLEFVSQVCGRHVMSFSKLWGNELWLLSDWFNSHREEYIAWCAENMGAIHSRAGAPNESISV